MILILLGSIAVPLRRALLQVANETLTRGAVQRAVKRLVPSNAIVSQQVSIGKDEIVIRLISTRASLRQRSLRFSRISSAEPGVMCSYR